MRLAGPKVKASRVAALASRGAQWRGQIVHLWVGAGGGR
jgi:hypothetical protein